MSPVKDTMKCEVGLHLVNKVLFPAVVISTSARFAVDRFWALAAPASKEARAKEYFMLSSSPDQGDAADQSISKAEPSAFIPPSRTLMRELWSMAG